MDIIQSTVKILCCIITFTFAFVIVSENSKCNDKSFLWIPKIALKVAESAKSKKALF